MYSFGDVTRLPEYGRDERAWSHHQADVIRRSQFGGCVSEMARKIYRWLDEDITR